MATVPQDPAGAEIGWLASLERVARGRRRALVLTHDNPDPDAIASALGLSFLLQQRCKVKCTVAYGGVIGREENRALVKMLRLPVVRLSRLDPDAFDLYCLVDTQPAATNHSLPSGLVAEVVVDHHPPRPSTAGVPAALVSEIYGATSSLVAALLRAADLEPDVELATALFYGVKTDTRSLSREADAADEAAYDWLFPRTDQAILALIENPQVPREYFRTLHRAIEEARVYDNVVWMDLGDVYNPDVVATLAERLVMLEGVKWSVALGIYDVYLYLSVRTNDRRMNAGKRVERMVSELGGSGGGHGQIAAARFDISTQTYSEVQALRARILHRFLTGFGAAEQEGRHLV